MLLGSKQHTEGDTRRWTINYGSWLDNTANLIDASVASNSTTCVVGDIAVLGPDVSFFLSGGERNERLTVSLTMTDNIGNIKNDTIAFTVVAP